MNYRQIRRCCLPTDVFPFSDSSTARKFILTVWQRANQASAQERAREKKRNRCSSIFLFSPSPPTWTFVQWIPRRVFFPYTHSKISKEKIEGLWTGYSRSPVMNYSHHETKQLKSAWEYVTIDFTYRPIKTVDSCSRAYLSRKKFSRTTFLSMTSVCLCFVQAY